MPALASPVTTEREGLVAYVVGALIKHAAGASRGWTGRIAAAPDTPPSDERPAAERMAEFADQFTMRDDETLADVLTRFDSQAEETPAGACRCRPGRRRAGAAGRAVVPAGRRVLVGALGGPAPSRSWPGMPATATSSGRRSTGQRCTSSLPVVRGGRRPTGSGRGDRRCRHAEPVWSVVAVRAPRRGQQPGPRGFCAGP